MTNEEVETMRAENRHLINQLNSSRTREAELQEKIEELQAELKKDREAFKVSEFTIRKLERENETLRDENTKLQNPLARGRLSSPRRDAVLEKLFFAIAVAEMLNCNGATAFLKLLDMCELSAQFKEWKEARA